MNARPSLGLLVVVAGILLIAGCDAPDTTQESPVFTHDVQGEVLPWTNENFDAAEDKFTFAIFSDLTGGERERVFEIAVAQLSLLRPEMIINVGDLIQGGTENLDEIDVQWNYFDERADSASAPIFYVGGNHDLTGAVLQGVWDQRYGRRYYHFVYKNVLFMVLDTEDNSPERAQEIFEIRNRALERVAKEGMAIFPDTEYSKLPEQRAGNIAAEQSQYFQAVLAANPDVRWTFIYMHKSPWKREWEQNFLAIEQAMANRPYTVFTGHVHTYEHEQRFGRDYIRLATTGGTQFPALGRSMDHVTLVTVDDDGADIVNLLMSGILDKEGNIPLGGNDVCFEMALCREAE